VSRRLLLKLGTSQSRVAKMEASDPRVSVDLLIQSCSRRRISHLNWVGNCVEASPPRALAEQLPPGR
jgi:hypothetical protein